MTHASRRRAFAVLAGVVACSSAPGDVPAFSNDPLSPRQGYMTRIGAETNNAVGVAASLETRPDVAGLFGAGVVDFAVAL